MMKEHWKILTMSSRYGTTISSSNYSTIFLSNKESYHTTTF